MKLHFDRQGRVLLKGLAVGRILKEHDRWHFSWAPMARSRAVTTVIRSQKLPYHLAETRLKPLKDQVRAFDPGKLEAVYSAILKAQKST